MKYFLLLLISTTISGLKGFTQLVDFSSYYDRTKKQEGYWKLKKFPIKTGTFQELYVHNKLIYKKETGSSTYYEILNRKYILISFFDTSYKYSSLGRELLRKGKVFIISIKNPSKQYFLDLRKDARSEGVLYFNEKKLLLTVRHFKTKEIIEIPAQPISLPKYNEKFKIKEEWLR